MPCSGNGFIPVIANKTVGFIPSDGILAESYTEGIPLSGTFRNNNPALKRDSIVEIG